MKTTSADGTTIAFDSTGSGPAIILVQGSFSDRTHPTWVAVAAALSATFTVYNYDRRGRGDSGDNQPYAVDREIEDLRALVEHAGGSATVFGASSGAPLALLAAAAGIGITRLVVFDPPYCVDGARPPVDPDLPERLATLVAEGRRGDAAEAYLLQAALLPAETVAGMRAQPFWKPQVETIAHTLAYDAAVLGPASAVPVGRLASIDVPTTVLSGGDSPGWMQAAGEAVAAAVPGARRRILDGVGHDADPQALATAVAASLTT